MSEIKQVLEEVRLISARLEQLELEMKEQGTIARKMSQHIWILDRLGEVINQISSMAKISGGERLFLLDEEST